MHMENVLEKNVNSRNVSPKKKETRRKNGFYRIITPLGKRIMFFPAIFLMRSHMLVTLAGG